MTASAVSDFESEPMTNGVSVPTGRPAGIGGADRMEVRDVPATDDGKRGARVAGVGDLGVDVGLDGAVVGRGSCRRRSRGCC